MPKFKAEITKDLQQDLNVFLDNLEMTRAEFLKLAIKAREYLVSNTSQLGAVGPNLLDAAQTKLAPLKEEAERRIEDLKSLRKSTNAAVSKKSAKASGASKSVVKSAAKAKASAEGSFDKILSTNQKVFERFVDQAKASGMTYKAYAESLGFKIHQVQRIKSEKAISFVPKLKAALDAQKK
jgi:hypothetical protein